MNVLLLFKTLWIYLKYMFGQQIYSVEKLYKII